jgi:hypothetical protein
VGDSVAIVSVGGFVVVVGGVVLLFLVHENNVTAMSSVSEMNLRMGC